MIDTQEGYEVLPATPTPATPTHHDLQNKREREKRDRVQRPERRKRGDNKLEVSEWKNVERID